MQGGGMFLRLFRQKQRQGTASRGIEVTSEEPDPQTPYPECYQSSSDFREHYTSGRGHCSGLAVCAWADTCARARQGPSEYAALIEFAAFLRLETEQHAIAHRTHPALHRRQLRPSASLSVLALENLRASARRNDTGRVRCVSWSVETVSNAV
jgi:hypothetical protein